MRTLFLGMPGPFSYLVLEGLVARGHKATAVVLPGGADDVLRAVNGPGTSEETLSEAGDELHIVNPIVGVGAAADFQDGGRGRDVLGPDRFGDSFGGPLRVATREGIPVYACGDIGHGKVSRWLEGLALDIVCAACWPQIIPAHVLAIPRFGILNVHPSLLPYYRGPYPLFWQFRSGEMNTGVTVHWMDSGLDTGDIAGQQSIVFEDGIRGVEAEALCASSGGSLASDILEALGAGSLVRDRQPEGGSYFGGPAAADFRLDATWHPRRAFNFMRGTAEYGVPFRYESDGRVQWFRDAVAWREGGGPRANPDSGEVWAAFRGGEVLVLT